MRDGGTVGTPEEHSVLTIRVDGISQDQLEQRIVKSVRDKSREFYAYLNVHAINLARRSPRLAKIIRDASVAYCDGEGVRLGAKILGITLPPRIVLTTWIWDICAICEREDISIFLLGASESTVQSARVNLQTAYPNLRIAGIHNGYFDKGQGGSAQVLEAIRSARPDILFVGFGMPLQEYWIEENRDGLDVHVIFPCGSMIEYVAGTKRPAPRWMSRNGLEWLYRLIKEPRRLWKRYLIGNPAFVVQILLHAWKKRSGS